MYAKGKIVGANVSSRNVRLGGTRSIWPLQAHRAGITPAVGVITAQRASEGTICRCPPSRWRVGLVWAVHLLCMCRRRGDFVRRWRIVLLSAP